MKDKLLYLCFGMVIGADITYLFRHHLAGSNDVAVIVCLVIMIVNVVLNIVCSWGED